MSEEAKQTINVIRDDMRKIYDAIDDLWGCIGSKEISALQPETIEVAKAVHTIMWHEEEAAQSESH